MTVGGDVSGLLKLVEDRFCTQVIMDRWEREAVDVHSKIWEQAETIDALQHTKDKFESEIGSTHPRAQAQMETIR